jgi:hypothetical protein
LLIAIGGFKGELPVLVGEDWPTFEAKLDDYLAQGQQGPVQASIMRALLLALFADYPAARDRLHIALAGETAHVAIMGETKSLYPASSPAPVSSVVTRYTDIACPSRAWIETPRINVVVRLTMQPVDVSAASEEVQVRTDAPVQVQIEAPRFEVLNDARQPIAVLPDQDSAPIVFDLHPLTVGPTQIALDFWQHGAPLRTVTVDVEISAAEVSAGVDAPSPQPLRMDPTAAPPDRVLHIAWDRDEAKLRFSLIQAGGAW